jgi:DNA-binding beta-propeller fold protein YncE
LLSDFGFLLGARPRGLQTELLGVTCTQLAEVMERPVHRDRVPFLTENNRCHILHPDGSAATSDQPVFEAAGAASLGHHLKLLGYGPATKAKLNQPEGFAFDRAGNLYVSDSANNRVRRIDARTGVITTVAGNGRHGYSGDGGPATRARLSDPYGLAFDAKGNLYVAEPDEGVVRRINPNGVITTFAGTGRLGFSGDGGPATKAKLNQPFGLAFDSAGNLYIADNGNHRIRKVNKHGVITTFYNGR